MTEAEWFACNDAREMHNNVQTSSRKLRLFSVACCRSNQRLLLEAVHREALDIAERWAGGEATEQDLTNVYELINKHLKPLNSCESEPEIQRWAEAVAVLTVISGDVGMTLWHLNRASADQIDPLMAILLRDIVGNPFQPLNPPWLMSEEGSKVRDWPQFANLRFKPEWLTADALAIARQIYESRDFSAMPILADALQDAGCDNDDILNHCRDANGVHVRGCWVVDLVLGKV